MCLNFCCITELVEFFHKPHVVMVLDKIFSLDFFILIPIELCLNTIVTGHVYPFLTTAYHLLMAASCRSSLFSPPLASHLNISMAQIIEEWFPAPCKTMPQRIFEGKKKSSPVQQGVTNEVAGECTVVIRSLLLEFCQLNYCFYCYYKRYNYWPLHQTFKA